MGEVIQVVLSSVSRATTIQRSSTFLVKKVHPRQNPDYAYARSSDLTVVQANVRNRSTGVAISFMYMQTPASVCLESGC